MSRILLFVIGLFATLLIGCDGAPTIAQLGGTRLVFKITSKKEPLEVVAAQTKLKQRLDPSGRMGIEIQIADEKVEVSVPAVEGVDLNAIRETLTAELSLSLHIVADKKIDLRIAELLKDSDRDESNAIVVDGGNVVAFWIRVPEADETHQKVFVSDEQHYLREVAGKLETLCLVSDLDIHSQHFQSASKTVDERKGIAIDFRLTEAGTKRMKALTTQNTLRYLAIVLSDRIISAPTIQSQISDRGQITGNFTEQEADNVVRTLAAGPLPFEFVDEPPEIISVAAP